MRKIAVFEDQKLIAALIAGIVREEGFEPVLFKNASAVHEPNFDFHQFAGVITDWSMGGGDLNGDEVIVALQKSGSYLPLLVHSSTGDGVHKGCVVSIAGFLLETYTGLDTCFHTKKGTEYIQDFLELI